MLATMQITIRQLQIIEAIVQTHNYSLAARRLHMTQPAVSMQMKSLEEAIDLAIFERHGKRIMLTSAGQEIYKYIHGINIQYADLKEAITEVKKGEGRIKVSAATTANHLITQMIANFTKKHSNISVALDITNRKQLIDQLQKFEPDIVIMGEPPEHLDLESEILIPNPLVMIAHPKHCLAGINNIPFSDIVQYDFVVREQGSGTRARIESFFSEHNAEFKSTMEMGSNEAIKHAVIADLGLSIVSLHTIKLELEAKKLVLLDVENFPLERHWHIIRRKGKHLLPAVESFQNFIIEEAKLYAKDYERFCRNW